jgi:hypothetical protein
VDEYPYSPPPSDSAEPDQPLVPLTTADSLGKPPATNRPAAIIASAAIALTALFIAVVPLTRSNPFLYSGSRYLFSAIVFGWLIYESRRAWQMSFGAGRSSAASVARVHSVPRRFGMGTLLVVTLAFSMLSALGRFALLPPLTVMLTFAFIGAVGLLQFIFDRAPRHASLLAGVIFFAVPLQVYLVGVNPNRFGFTYLNDFLFRTSCLVCLGATLGYVAGVVVGSLFMFITWGQWLIRARR